MITVRERVTVFLLERPLRNYCDACLARALGIDPSTAYRAATRLTSVTRFAREYAMCSECGASRLITRSVA